MADHFTYLPVHVDIADQIATVATVADLPTGVPEGSVRYVMDVDLIYQYDGSTWVSNSVGDVASVNGQTGTVVLTTTNISEGTNQYFTTERAQDAVGTILTDTASIDFTYNDPSNTISATVLPAGIDKNVLGGSALSIANGGTGQTTQQTAATALVLDPAFSSFLFDDWISATEAGSTGWTTASSGAGSGGSTSGGYSDVFNRADGTMSLTTGTTTTGRAALHRGTTMGFGYTSIVQKWRMIVPNLSTAVDEYSLIFGFGDTPTGAGTLQTHSTVFVYDRTLSTNWIARTRAAGVSTDTITTVAVSTAAMQLFEIRVNTAGTSVTFYIGGVLVATHTTNIPGFIQFIGPIIKIAKSAGTTARTAIFDYFWQLCTWSATR